MKKSKVNEIHAGARKFQQDMQEQRSLNKFDDEEFLKSLGVNAARDYFNGLRRSAQWIFDEVKRSENRFLEDVKKGDNIDAVHAIESCALAMRQFDNRSEQAVRAAVRVAVGLKVTDF